MEMMAKLNRQHLGSPEHPNAPDTIRQPMRIASIAKNSFSLAITLIAILIRSTQLDSLIGKPIRNADQMANGNPATDLVCTAIDCLKMPLTALKKALVMTIRGELFHLLIPTVRLKAFPALPAKPASDEKPTWHPSIKVK